MLSEGKTGAHFRRKHSSRVTPQKNGVMSERETEKSKINAYLLDVLSSELEEANRYAVTDPYVRFAYDRLRELYWTTTRALGKLVALAKGNRPRADVPGGEALTGDIPAPPARARLLIDMTHTVDGGFKTGIQRVVREIARNCVETGAGLPVTIDAGRIFSHFRHPALPVEIEPGPGDILLLPRRLLEQQRRLSAADAALQGARRKDGRRGLRHIAAGLSLAVSARRRRLLSRLARGNRRARRRRRRHLPLHGRKPP